jgi:hypothetical protein
MTWGFKSTARHCKREGSTVIEAWFFPKKVRGEKSLKGLIRGVSGDLSKKKCTPTLKKI